MFIINYLKVDNKVLGRKSVKTLLIFLCKERSNYDN